MSSSKNRAAALQSPYSDSLLEVAQNNHDMSVTPDVSHVEMWPYVASAAVASASHAATAIRMVMSVIGLELKSVSQSELDAM